ncbi:Com family DNA-binding transcriptional regulator [Pseudomonas resinovorans]|uniref:Com family DNA-binding transcriptional regulator n=1 Tax=Metapseudomonas resinovorans TaxID=53412 RepID=A0ABT4Y6S7_METRE|nr:Com family DNA-binding transcriptional regulator [Pseudomonas resinovorans]MDA8484389.1 Com family DNA-binding transcriptional regulator [Pseudomonas resinovorans]
MFDIRCGGCSRLLGRASGSYILQIKCPRCRTLNHLKAESLPPAPPSARHQEALCPHNPSSLG